MPPHYCFRTLTHIFQQLMWSTQNEKTKLLTQKNHLKRRLFKAFWSECGDSNPGPPAPKAGALPTALHPVIQFFIRLGVFSQTRRDTNFAIPGYFFSIPQLWVEGKRKFLVYINKVVIGGRLPADDDLIQICIKHLACCALRQREGDIRAEKVGVDGQVEAAALQLHQAPCDG